MQFTNLKRDDYLKWYRVRIRSSIISVICQILPGWSYHHLFWRLWDWRYNISQGMIFYIQVKVSWSFLFYCHCLFQALSNEANETLPIFNKTSSKRYSNSLPIADWSNSSAGGHSAVITRGNNPNSGPLSTRLNQ